MRIKRETMMEKLQEELKSKVQQKNLFLVNWHSFLFTNNKDEELKRIHIELDHLSHHHTPDIQPINHSIYDRVRSAPFLSSHNRKVNSNYS